MCAGHVPCHQHRCGSWHSLAKYLLSVSVIGGPNNHIDPSAINSFFPVQTIHTLFNAASPKQAVQTASSEPRGKKQSWAHSRGKGLVYFPSNLKIKS